ncbi:hypothetical protein [Planococcus sp. YIM B11945]|uniref:hypothetical protein n=1 Tax=Planococcus sp. YIM B11945 TaxID=3435410 RepID=UPI003D7CD359
MISHYYLCELTNDEKVEQQLEAYEWEQGFTADWVNIDQAIRKNHVALAKNADQPFLHRENFVLGKLKRTVGL